MLRQIERLTRALTGAGSEGHAIAVYAEPDVVAAHERLATRSAHESGVEGVACVDDAARAIVLYCRLWHQSRLDEHRIAAYRLLQFLAYMQEPDGRFSNFIFDWAGHRNRSGITSVPGGGPWQARATHALACAVSTFREPEWDARFKLAVSWLDAPTPYLDVRAVGVLAVLEHWHATGSSASATRAISWSADISAHSSNGRLLNASGVLPIHLWGHLQESALAATGAALGRPELVETARRSADSLLMPIVERGFPFDHVLPFDVSCTILNLDAVAEATGDRQYTAAAMRGRNWFSGRNTANESVFDGERGLVFDGIDNGLVSQNSGAESNIEGALALLS